MECPVRFKLVFFLFYVSIHEKERLISVLYLPQTLSQPDNGMSDKAKGELAFQSPGIAIILLEIL